MDTNGKGSIWRKWDLHVHTPASVLNNGFGDNWDDYVQKLFKKLIEKEIAVVGITDYFTIDGYKKIREEYLNDENKLKTLFTDQEIDKIKQILVIPNIEFRANIFVGSKSVNFHIFFSESVSPKDIEEKFLHEINFIFQGDPQSEDKKRKLRVVNLEELGATLKSEHSEFTEPALYVGMMNAVVDHNEVTTLLAQKESTFGGKYLFVVMADEDLSKLKWNSREHLTRKILIQKSDLLFSSNPNTRNWGLGLPPYLEGNDKFREEFKSLKPCIHGSDAHEYFQIGHPCSKRGDKNHDCTSLIDCELRFCWVKADPTFEGLRQVLYEPEDRILIQDSNPSPLKSTQSISEFSITETILEPELKFKKTNVHFNEGLVAVTGGKGSGKTALVDLIANIYEDRVNSDDKNSFTRRISDNENPIDLPTSLKLQNEDVFTKEIKDELFIEGASIVYVAQGELEKHVEDPAHLESYINKLIFESNEIKDSELLFDYSNINDETKEISQNLFNVNLDIFNLENETSQKIEEDLQKEEKKFNTELIDTNKKIEELSKVLSKEKIKEAEEKQKQLTALRDRKTNLTDLGVTIKEALKFVNESIPLFNGMIEKINSLSSKLDYKESFKSMSYLDGRNLSAFIETVRDAHRKTVAEIDKYQKELEEKEKGVKEHAKLLDKKKELEKSIQLIKEKLKIIGEKKKLLEDEKRRRIEIYESLLLKRIAEKDKYHEIILTFSANKNDILSDLEFTAELIFDHLRFIKTMSELVDLRKVKVDFDNDSDTKNFIDSMNALMLSPTPDKVKAVTFQINLLLGIIVQNQKRAETISRLTVTHSIFSDYLSVVPSVKYKKVRLNKLSLGQKATVLLKIYLAQGENPIIIDSHDDHLDNEFIMEELVKALRQAKQHRQVIIVSNNGNVVINSDAEQVVISSRTESGEISYVTGSLENPSLREKLLSVLEGGEIAFEKRQEKYRLV